MAPETDPTRGPTRARGRRFWPGGTGRSWLPVVLLLWGCAAQAPSTEGDWRRPVEQRYPPDRYIVGTGCAPSTGDPGADQARADELARSDVQKQIRVRVKQIVESEMGEERTEEGGTLSRHSVEVRTEEVVEGTLRGVRIVDRHASDPAGMWCSLAVLDKVAAAQRIRAEVERLRDEVRAHRAAAKRAEEEGRWAEALRARTLSVLAVERAAVEADLFRDLGFTGLELPPKVEVRREWRATLEALRLRAVSGNAQRGHPGHALDAPLTVRATGKDGTPVANLPLEVLEMQPPGEMQREALTDAFGEARFQVSRVPGGGFTIGEVRIGLDWERLLPAGDEGRPEAGAWEAWDRREVGFTYTVPHPSEYTVAVAVYEHGTGRPLRRSVVHASVLEGLQKGGFKTRDLLGAEDLGSSPFGSRPDAEAARKALEGRAEILLLGDVSLRFSNRSPYGFVFYRARGVLQGFSVGNGRVLATLDTEAKGGGLDEERAARKALQNLAEELRIEIGPALQEVLE